MTNVIVIRTLSFKFVNEKIIQVKYDRIFIQILSTSFMFSLKNFHGMNLNIG